MHTVPALQHNGIALTDSHSILLYLADQFGGEHNDLLPQDTTKRLLIIDKLFFNGTVLFKRDSEALVRI